MGYIHPCRLLCTNRFLTNMPNTCKQVAALAIKAKPWTIHAALLLSVVQVAWLALSAVAGLGSASFLQTAIALDRTVHRASTCSRIDGIDGDVNHKLFCMCGGEGTIFKSSMVRSPCVFRDGRGSFWLGCLWLASGAWGVAVLQNLITATVTRSVASWWFSPGDNSSVRDALYRATHDSFG